MGRGPAQHGDNIFGIWYTYDLDEKPLWVVMPGGVFEGNTFTATLYTTTGTPYDRPFVAADTKPAVVGTAKLVFEGDVVRFTGTIHGHTKSRILTRQPFGTRVPNQPPKVGLSLLGAQPAVAPASLTLEASANDADGKVAALKKEEYSWAAKLANQLCLIDDRDTEARQLKAEALRQMAYVSTGANDRAHLMSQALALEGKITIARLIPPLPESIAAMPSTFVDYFRVRIDPAKSYMTNKLIRFEFSDGSKSGLHIGRALAEFVREPDGYGCKPDVTLAMTGQTWVKLYLSQAAPEDLIKSG